MNRHDSPAANPGVKRSQGGVAMVATPPQEPEESTMAKDDKQDLSEQDEPEQQAMESVEQETLDFYGRPIVIVTLADGRRGVVLRWMCEGLAVDTQAQVRRLRRSPTTKGEVWSVRVDTESAWQTMPTLNY